MGKNILFIGSRIHVFKECQNFNLSIVKIYALKNSPLYQYLAEQKIAFKSFEVKDKKNILEDIYKQDFDFLISNGCPYIFPVDKFKNDQILLNIHPTYLPHLQGKTPLNGIFYLEYDFYGATFHLIDKGIDTGNIIYQEKHNITPDLDLGLIYYLSMKLEGVVFKKGWEIILNNNFKIDSSKQIGTSSYFNRTDDMRIIDFDYHTTDDILRIIKSFGISSQGSYCNIGNKKYIIFKASKIINNEILTLFNKNKTGSILLNYDTNMLLKTIDGVIKVEKFNVV
ncbi:hypothetical protein KO500_09825 [Cellulophaga baltica]|uniref:formyltransferase family protein n=1 Tax=Cellulophaga TaxID=104264 RepID=UPI001C07B14F|nr:MULTISPECIES: formyltransferase family protein [Cellulophaga]MBU2996734.1 hypothetical protein [Cellulophaga baltica]MDO6768130.1 formyltransferase family protein [Cellulophaga sp. 1_MG-2023]